MKKTFLLSLLCFLLSPALLFAQGPPSPQPGMAPRAPMPPRGGVTAPPELGAWWKNSEVV